MKVLITGAAGQTGLAVIQALKRKDCEVTIRALVRQKSQCETVIKNGADESFIGDMKKTEDMKSAMKDMEAVYHICSTANENEYEIGKLTYNQAKNAGVKRFVYHSVLHPIFSDLPHHEKKHKLERMICEGKIPYVILQPAALMQNLMISKEMIINEGIFMQRFFAEDDVRMNLVDLDDVACIAANALTQPEYEFGTYELCGPKNLSEQDIINALEKSTEKTIESRFISDDMFKEQMKTAGKSESYISTLLSMFHHYQKQGFMGNSTTLRLLLGRSPTTLEEYLNNNLTKYKSE